MEQNYTQNQLVQFIYQESPFFEYFEIENALNESRQLRRQYRRLLSASQELPKLQLEPTQAVLDRIMNYSRLAA